MTQDFKHHLKFISVLHHFKGLRVQLELPPLAREHPAQDPEVFWKGAGSQISRNTAEQSILAICHNPEQQICH